MTTINYKALVKQSVEVDLPARLKAARSADRAKLSHNERTYRWHRVRTEAQFLADMALMVAKEVDRGMD